MTPRTRFRGLFSQQARLGPSQLLNDFSKPTIITIPPPRAQPHQPGAATIPVLATISGHQGAATIPDQSVILGHLPAAADVHPKHKNHEGAPNMTKEGKRQLKREAKKAAAFQRLRSMIGGAGLSVTNDPTGANIRFVVGHLTYNFATRQEMGDALATLGMVAGRKGGEMLTKVGLQELQQSLVQ